MAEIARRAGVTEGDGDALQRAIEETRDQAQETLYLTSVTLAEYREACGLQVVDPWNE